MIDKILDLFFIPNSRCPLCYRVLVFTEDFICDSCEKSLKIISEKRCKKCSKEISGIMNYCSDCIEINFSFTKAFSLYHYDKNMKKIIHHIKFLNNPKLAEYMGKKLGRALLHCPWLEEVDIIIPVPLHDNRFKSRGYNQSSLISQGVMSVLIDDHGLTGIILDAKSLIRYKDTPHQLDLSREERFANVKRAFKVVDKINVLEKNILLVDDVYTTGATIDSCTNTLIKSGAKKVYIATLAMGKSRVQNV